MRKSIPRREFLRNAGASGLVGAGLALPHLRPNVADAAMVASPSDEPQPARPRLFVGCCAYSYQKYLETGRMTMEDFILKGAELGVHGVDITTYWLKSAEPSYLAGLRHLAFRNGMPFSGAAISTHLCQPDAAKRAQELEKIKHWVDAIELLGASHLRIFAGEIPKNATLEQGIRWTVEVMKPACEYSGKKGITLGLEDHSGITTKAAALLEIIRRVDSPYAGINLDISNFSAASTEEQYAQIEACVLDATHTHIRDRFSESHEPIDLDRVFQLFARGGYKGYMSAEYEGDEDPLTGVPKLIEKIKSLCKKYSSA